MAMRTDELDCRRIFVQGSWQDDRFRLRCRAAWQGVGARDLRDARKVKMGLSDLVCLEAVLPSLKVQSKKQAIQELSARAAKLTGISERAIFDTLYEREQLGSTGIGHGIAIPHGKLPTLKKLVGLFARLERPIDFDSIDDQPVDLIFVLLAPEGAGADHLKALALVARFLRDPTVTATLRGCRDIDSAYSVLTHSMTSNTAA
jgi:PTS system nitrogen regulatory IIA component